MRPLEPMQVSSFDQQAKSHGLHLQPEAIVSDLGSADPLLNSVSQSSCKASLSTGDLCIAANYREKTSTKGAREDGTFSINYQCCYPSPMFVDQSSQSSPHTRDLCIGAVVQTTGA